MALNPHVQTSYSNHVLSYIEKLFLALIKKELLLAPLGMAKLLGKRQGNTIRFIRWDSPSGSTSTLSDGVTPDGISLTTAVVNATLSQYGRFAAVSDRLQDVAINDTLKDMTGVLAYDAALSIDQLVRNELDANGTQNYADDASNSSIANVETNTDKIRSTELKILLKNFRVADVKPFDNGLYRGVIHPLMEFDLLSETTTGTFMELVSKTSADPTRKGLIGTAYGIELMRSSNIRADATYTNTYGNIFVGKDAFGTISIDSLSPEMIIKALGSAGTEDALNQRATVGYKFWYVAKVLRTVAVQTLWAYSVGV